MGALLWALALPDVANGAHHLGLGKPLGMGSCKVHIAELTLVDRKQRYENFTGLSLHPHLNPILSQEPFKKYMDTLQNKLLEWFGGQSLSDLPHVRDLRIILSQDQPAAAGPDVPICYPPGLTTARAEADSDLLNPEELHYTWFGGRGEDWSQALLTIEEISRNGRQLRAKE